MCDFLILLKHNTHPRLRPNNTHPRLRPNGCYLPKECYLRLYICELGACCTGCPVPIAMNSICHDAIQVMVNTYMYWFN
jgi:hypothetical protein